MEKVLKVGLYCFVVFGLSSCVGLEGEPQIFEPDGPPPKLTSAQMQLIEPFIGEWGFRSCSDQKALRERCNRRHLIVARNGTMTIEVPNKRSTGLASSSSLYMVPVNKNVLENRSEEGFIRLTLAKEGGVAILKYRAEVGKARLSQKYLSVTDLRRGYSIDNIQTNPRVAFYGSASGNVTSVSSASGGGSCGLSKADANEGSRRTNFTEISKAKSFGAFQNDSVLKSQVNASAIPAGYSSFCQAAGAQVSALLPAYNAANTASDKIVNGSPLGLTCSGNQSSASQASACNALVLWYQMQQSAFACHYACETGK